MRKLTGYIGAMIIVFALMGSVLMGFALNVNGTNTIVNEYERVTDVSGLYAHSEEKTYIEYNPAINYIGYSTQTETYNNSKVRLDKQYLSVDNSTVYIGEGANPGVVLNGDGTGWPNQGNPPYYAFVCDRFYMYYESDQMLHLYACDRSITATSGVTINVNLPTITVTVNGTTYTYSDNTLALCYNQFEYDYYCFVDIWDGGRTLMLNSPEQILATTVYSGSSYGFITGNDYYRNGTTNTVNFVTLTSSMDHGVGLYSVGGSPYGDTVYGVFYPKTVISVVDLGINYTESNKVNNYLIEKEYIGGTVTTVTDTLNLYSGMNLTDYATTATMDGITGKYWNVGLYYDLSNFYSITYFAPSYTGNDLSTYIDAVHKYKLTDVLSFYNISTTNKITVRVGGGTNISLDGGRDTLTTNNITSITVSGNGHFLNTTGTAPTDYIEYNPLTGIVDYYRENGIKAATYNVNDVYISFSDSSARYGIASKYQWYPTEQSTSYLIDYGVRVAPHIDISYLDVTGGTVVNHYMDITKGISIKNDNATITVWNNEYENGIIQLLFRADQLNSMYHNKIGVSNNDIEIDFIDGRFYVNLNNGDDVDVGTWRNIVLDIDLINNKLSVIPVRTFNSYTNVVLDNTKITIGDLVGAVPTNGIWFYPTTNSFMFNVYSTSVFMNTYGIVMINPSLDITDYFTDLNDFYRLDLYNFATYGDSITINGETLTVNNGKIEYGDVKLELKNFSITYADGGVTIEDSHTSVEMGAIVTTAVSMTGAWYFITDLERGYTTEKLIYDWDWGTFIFDNTQFAVFYLGFMAAALIVARKFCTLTIIDYAIIMVSVIIALGVQVIA